MLVHVGRIVLILYLIMETVLHYNMEHLSQLDLAQKFLSYESRQIIFNVCLVVGLFCN